MLASWDLGSFEDSHLNPEGRGREKTGGAFDSSQPRQGEHVVRIELCAPRRHAEILAAGTCECDLIWKSGALGM